MPLHPFKGVTLHGCIGFGISSQAGSDGDCDEAERIYGAKGFKCWGGEGSEIGIR